VGFVGRSGIPHLTPTLSAPGGGEGVKSAPTPAAALAQARRLVVKIGSALLVDEEGEIHRAWLDALVDDLARCRGRNQDVIVVSSGAIAVGRRHLGLRGRALRLEEKQAAAATGQIRLAHAYQEALARHGITVAQVLLTLEDTEDRRRHLNARATLATLCNRVAETREPYVIERRGRENVALISEAELNALLETAHLLRSPKNAARLASALERAERGQPVPKSLDELRRSLGLEEKKA
jgi:PHD/YefM family antitoxin component YafN of YafNO toxin-antitoxin module